MLMTLGVFLSKKSNQALIMTRQIGSNTNAGPSQILASLYLETYVSSFWLMFDYGRSLKVMRVFLENYTVNFLNNFKEIKYLNISTGNGYQI